LTFKRLKDRFLIGSAKVIDSYKEIFEVIMLRMVIDGVKRLLNTMIDAEGNLQNPICNFGPHLNGRTTIGIGDAEEFPELLKVDKFPKQELSYGIIQALLGQGLITSKGPLWKRQRRYLTPLFHFKNLTFMPTSITKRALEFCSKLKQLNGTPISPIHPFGALSLQIVVDCVFGGSDYLNADELAHIWEKLNSALNKYILSAILLGESVSSPNGSSLLSNF
jgi:hypothetical protein